tara:strand:+ start:324 stop:1076 length:753 start_codon:yes stop_codon:yes gene_type:complete
MKIEEKIKQKFLYKPGFNLIKSFYFLFQKIKKKKFLKKSFSGSAQDIIIDHFFKNKNDGVYIDVGCYHPYNGNNTKRLYDRGWSGINIDLDFHTIDLFNYIRKRDDNINVAISDKEGEFDLYYFHNRSALNSLDESRKKNAKQIKKVKTKTLNSIIENSKFQNDKINFLSIDVEGHEFEIIKSIDLNRYSPEIVLIEFMEKKSNEIKFYNQNINSIINSDLYNYMNKHNYYFVNWINNDLVFAHTNIRNK